MSTIVVLNWKMNPVSQKEAKQLFTATKTMTERRRDLQVIVAPPSIYLSFLRRLYTGKKVAFSAQAGRSQPNGAYTGSVSLAQSADMGARYAIIGHAERRAAGESNDDVRSEVAAAYALGMMPIVCIGEKQRSPDNAHLQFIREQLMTALADIPQTKIASMIIAYEPVWAIGAAHPMEPRQMHEMAVFIRKTLNELYGPRAMNAAILYGGSIDEQSAGDMMVMGDVKGLLVGRASVDATRLAALISSIPTHH